jgi:hypothetical protein
VVVLQYLDLVYCLCVSASSQGLWWRNRLCARLSPPISWGSNPVGTTDDSHVKGLSQRSAENRGFSPGTPVSSHGEC